MNNSKEQVRIIAIGSTILSVIFALRGAGLLVAILILVMGFAVAVYILAKPERDRMKQEIAAGNVIRRKSRIWEEEEFFFVETTYEQIISLVENTDFTPCRAEIEIEPEGDEGILFIGINWQGWMEYHGIDDRKEVFSFSFPEYSSNLTAEMMNDMNIALTLIEKMFMRVDPEVEIEVHKRRIVRRSK